MVESRGLQNQIQIDSAGTGRWHVGQPPDERSTAYAKTRGVDLSPLRARQFREEDYEEFDLILCMDDSNRSDVLDLCYDDKLRGRVHLFLDFVPELSGQSVPDPYSGGMEGFKRVFDLVEKGCEHLLTHIQTRLVSG